MKNYTKSDTERNSLMINLGNSFDSKRILIIEDTELNRETVNHFIENNSELFEQQYNSGSIIIVKIKE